MVSMGDTSSPSAAERPREPWGSWSSLFQHSADPVFLLSRRRQLRYVNRAWEALTGKSGEDMRGMFCLPLKKKGGQPLRTLLQALAPSPEVMEGRSVTLRRAAPPARVGPPWWDVTFVPLGDEAGPTAILGFIHVIEPAPGSAAAQGLSDALIALRQQTAARFCFDCLRSETAAMHRVEAQARLASRTKAPVWIAGEAGAGKESLARIIHFEGTTRDQTFLAIDCAGLQPFLIRTMLFGHTGQAGARLGAVYLKDPAKLPRDLQAELVDWVEEQESPPRIVVGSRDLLGDELKAGKLVEEFHAAFNVLEIRLPALRDRLDDLPRLAAAMLRRDVAAGTAPPEIAAEALDLLRRHPWPGNLRELARTLREASAAASSHRIEPAHLPLEMRAGPVKPAVKPLPTAQAMLEQVEARLIRLALRRAKGNKAEAAERLGMTRGRLLRRIEVLKLEEA
jgi:transcriptional regulator with PAS, ATPase and Fis domain